jgi:hypothetical protein
VAVLVVKMATVLEKYNNKKQRSVLRFCGQKYSIQSNIHKEMFPVYGGKCLLSKEVHNWMANVSLLKKLKQRCGSG